MASLTSAPLCIEHIALSPWHEINSNTWNLKFKIHAADHLDDLCFVATPQSNSVTSPYIEWAGFKDHEHSSRLIESDLDITATMRHI